VDGDVDPAYEGRDVPWAVVVEGPSDWGVSAQDQVSNPVGEPPEWSSEGFMSPVAGSYADPSCTWTVYLSSLVHYNAPPNPKEYTDDCSIYEDVEIRLSGV
jgi:hypothetical protein